jgi:hypothetical protein
VDAGDASGRAASLVLVVEHFTSRRIAQALSRYVGYFSAGFAAVRSPGRLATVAVLVVAALGRHRRRDLDHLAWFGIQMDFAGSFLMQPLLVLGVAVGTPGGLGPYQWAYVVGVTLFFGASQETAVASSFVVWLISFVPTVIVGLVYMAQDGLSVGRLETLAAKRAARSRLQPMKCPFCGHLGDKVVDSRERARRARSFAGAASASTAAAASPATSGSTRSRTW